MVLAVDIGNTNIVMGCFESDRILFVERLSTNQQSTALEYAIMLKNILEIHSIDMSDFRGGIISSVVPSVTLTMKEAMERLIKKRIMVVGPGIKTGLKINLTAWKRQSCRRSCGDKPLPCAYHNDRYGHCYYHISNRQGKEFHRRNDNTGT